MYITSQYDTSNDWQGKWKHSEQSANFEEKPKVLRMRARSPAYVAGAQWYMVQYGGKMHMLSVCKPYILYTNWMNVVM